MTASNLLHKLIRSNSSLIDLRAESLNKNLLLSHKCNISFGHDLTLFFSKMILTVNRANLNEVVIQNSLQINILLKLIEAIITDRKATTTSEDFFSLLKWLKSDIFFVVLKDLGRVKCEGIVYKAGSILNSVIQSLETKEAVRQFQNKMLNHSTLILDHIKMLVSPITPKQFSLSTTLVYHIVLSNVPACTLLGSIFPKSIFRLIDATANDISK